MAAAASVRATVAVSIVTALLTASAVSLAGASFTDVGPSHPFRADIEAIAAAGITTGYEDGSFRPGANVTRGAMAAFMRRGFGRVSSGENASATNVPSNSSGSTPIASTSITVGASGSGTGGYVHVVGHVTGFYDARPSPSGWCPCGLSVSVREGGTLVTRSGTLSSLAPGSDSQILGIGGATATVVGVFPVPAGVTRTYQLRATNTTAAGSAVGVIGRITATYVPFDGTGNAG